MTTRNKVAERDDVIVEFCTGGKTMQEIAKHVGMNASSLGNHIARLQMEKRLEKILPNKREFGKGGVVCIFIKPGTELTHEPVVMTPVQETGPVYNWDFIYVMHRILHLESA